MTIRNDVPQEQTWNAEALFDSWDAVHAERKAVEASLPDLQAYAGTLTTDAETLADFLDLMMETERRIMSVYTYSGMAGAVDTEDKMARSTSGQVVGLFGKYMATTAFAVPEMLAAIDTLTGWAAANPRLAMYAQYLQNLQRIKPHVLSPELEKVMGMLAEPFSAPGDVAFELANTDLKFADAIDSTGKAHPVTQGTPPPRGIQFADREQRRTAWENFYNAHKGMENTFAAAYIGNVKQHVFGMRMRGYESVLHMQLAPTSLPTTVFHTLLETFQKNLPVWHRYWSVRQKALGVDAIQPYDLWAPLLPQDIPVSYQQAVDWIAAGMAPLGEEYVSVLRRGCLEDRWVDYAPNATKSQGAFATLSTGVSPFIMTSYNDTLQAMSTLAHELGHAMHSWYTFKHQPLIYNGYSGFGNGMGVGSSVAETASNFNQALTRAYLQKVKADDRAFQIALIDEAMVNFHRYFFIMPTLARFEAEVFQRAEQGEPLNADILNGILGEFFAEGYGDTMHHNPDHSAITWTMFPHLFQPFYTFQYAVGISAAHALMDDVLGGKPNAVDQYLAFLSAGGSLYEMDLFTLAGVDMSSPEPIEKAFAVMAGMIDDLDRLVS